MLRSGVRYESLIRNIYSSVAAALMLRERERVLVMGMIRNQHHSSLTMAKVRVFTLQAVVIEWYQI